MDTITRNEEFNQGLFSGMRDLLDRNFLKKKEDVKHKVNAKIILDAIKTRDIDKEKYISTIKNLSEEEWSQGYLVETIDKLNDIIGISDEFLKNNSVDNIEDASDLKETKWELAKMNMRDYAKFSKEFYDSLKYSRTVGFDRDRRMLMLTIMEVLKKIHESAKDITSRFYNKRYNNNSFKRFMETKMALDHLFLRVMFILLNIENDGSIRKYRTILAHESAEYNMSQKK